MAAADNTYQYKPLAKSNAIRVLLLSGGSGTNIFTELLETTVTGGEPYEALSYAWGDAKKSHTIALRGGKSLRITASLHSALKNLRRRSVEDGARAIWADGVCINQEDQKERGQQVQMMATIYRSAKRVITYVGEDQLDVAKGLDLARKLIRLAEQRQGQSVNAVMHTVDPELFGLPNFRDSSWDALRGFLSKRWYTRMWIVQESLLNTSVRFLWNQHEFDANMHDQLVRKVVLTGSFPQSAGLIPITEQEIGSLGAMSELRSLFRPSGGLPIIALLEPLRNLECGDARDRIFALASISADYKPTVDYSKDTRQIFIEAAVRLLRQGPRILSCAGVRIKLARLPSWVPDWTVPAAQIPVLHCRMFHACGSLNVKFAPKKVNIQAGTLELQGMVFDRVVHLTDKLQLGIMTARMARSKWAKDQFVRLLKLGYYPGDRSGCGSYLDALWRTLICNLNVADHTARKLHSSSEAPSTLAHDFEAWVRPDVEAAGREARSWMLRQNGTGRMAMAPTAPEVLHAWSLEQHLTAGDRVNRVNIFKSIRGVSDIPGDSLGWEYRDAILKAGNLYRRLCTTEQGYIGVVPDEARVGDVLVFLPGALVPFVFRPLQDQSSYWNLGDCYLHGLMHGEAFKDGIGQWQSLTLV